MKKKIFILILSLFFILPCAIFFSGCDEEDLIGISAQEPRKQIEYGQDFNPITSFKVRSHYYDGSSQYLTEKDLTYTITKNDEIYEYEDYIDGGNYIFEFTYKGATCKAYLTVKRIDCPEINKVVINDFGFNETVSMPTLETTSNGEINFYYRQVNSPKVTDKLWLYENGDINTTIQPGDYVIYAKVQNGTNYNDFETEDTQFHVYPEKLDESYTLSTSEIVETYVINGTLNSYSGSLANVKLMHNETECSGHFEWLYPNTSIVYKEEATQHYVKYVSDDEHLNNKQFVFNLTLNKLLITKPTMTLNPDKTTAQNSIVYDGTEHAVYVNSIYNLVEIDINEDEDDEEEPEDPNKTNNQNDQNQNQGQIHEKVMALVDQNGTALATLGGNIKATSVGTYTTEILLRGDEGICWADGTTESIRFDWSITSIPFDSSNIVFMFNKNVIVLDPEEENPDPTQLNYLYTIAQINEEDILYVENGETINLQQYAFALLGVAIKNQQTNEYEKLPYTTSVLNPMTDDYVCYNLYSAYDENGNLVLDENNYPVYSTVGTSIAIFNFNERPSTFTINITFVFTGNLIYEDGFVDVTLTITK